MGLAAAFDDEPAFVPYLCVGDPDLETSTAYVEALVEGGADAVELGLPFSEPIAEGPTIQGAIRRALAAGTTPERYFEFVEDLDVDVPLVCMTYYNLLYQYGNEQGVDPVVERAARAGIDGFVVPDLPIDEAEPLAAACESHGLDLVFIVAPTTTDDRLDRIRELVSGYVYVQARLGTTGASEEVGDAVGEGVARVADWPVPAAVGFGISSEEQAREVIAAGADGIIVGSALVDVVADGVEQERSTDAVADDLREMAATLKRGALAGAEGAVPERS
jgi:tryptophan synthase alpha chain